MLLYLGVLRVWIRVMRVRVSGKKVSGVRMRISGLV